MSITLYFAKLNLISDDIFELYNDPDKRKDISNALYKAINEKTCWEKENIYFDEDGEAHTSKIEYNVHITGKDDNEDIVDGWIYKESCLYYKKLNETTGELVQHYTDNTEGIRFVLDLNHGFVGYNTATRFGYKEFLEAFVNIVNIGEEKNKSSYRYNINICTSGIDLNDIKAELKKVGNIRELKIRMQPPNPSDDLLDELQKRCDGMVDAMKKANITEVEYVYSTKGTSGININSSFVNERLEDIQGLHSSLTVEESTQKGYASVEATSTAGHKYSSGESKPLKKVIFGLEEIVTSCVDMFRALK